jgi:dolichyl-phosphate beta-glucosyltransferase
MNYPYAVSLIIPVYNESERLTEGLKKILRYLPRASYRSEIILVDDGSTDDTLALARSILASVKDKKILTHEKNKGKGAAIRTGMLEANGKYLIFSDIDFSTPITELTKILDGLKIADVVIGVRRHKDSHVLKHQPKLREALGQVFTKLTSELVTPGILDVTCGFKGYRSEAAKFLFKKSHVDRWAFDAEILFLAKKEKLKILQVPVTWSDTKGSKVHILSDGIGALVDIVKIKGRN